MIPSSLYRLLLSVHVVVVYNVQYDPVAGQTGRFRWPFLSPAYSP